VRRNIRVQVVRTAQSRRVQNDRGTGWLPPTRHHHAESAIDHTRSGTERRARTTTDALVYEAQNGTSACNPGVLTQLREGRTVPSIVDVWSIFFVVASRHSNGLKPVALIEPACSVIALERPEVETSWAEFLG
jgi:hypothetical protein